MKWDSLLWEAEFEEDENEIQITIEGACSGIDDRTIQRLEDEGVEVVSIKIRPEETTPVQSRPY